jgi:hypothetical protein
VTRCNYPPCGKDLPQHIGKGRPLKYCSAACAKAANREHSADRQRAKRAVNLIAELLTLPPCCADAKLANHRVSVCPQHRQFYSWKRDTHRTHAANIAIRTNDLAFFDAMQNMAGGCRVSPNPDAWHIVESEADKKLDKQTDAWLAEHDPIKSNTTPSTLVEGETPSLSFAKVA